MVKLGWETVVTEITDVLANSDELYDPIFVVGCPRSGTGVLARTIGLSEEVCYVGETKFIFKYYTRRLPFTVAMQHWLSGEPLLPVLKGKVRRLQEQLEGKDSFRDLIGDLIKYIKLPDYNLKPPGMSLISRYGVNITREEVKLQDQLFAKYTQLGRKDVDRTLRILFKDVQILSHTSRILEKTPLHALFISILKRVFPKAKICRIVRDGREVAASYMLNFGNRKIDDSAIKHICSYYRRVGLIDEQLTSTNEPGHYRVRYDELVARPVAVMEGVFDFVDLPFSDRVRRALAEIKPTESKWEQLPKSKQIYVEACLGRRSA